MAAVADAGLYKSGKSEWVSFPGYPERPVRFVIGLYGAWGLLAATVSGAPCLVSGNDSALDVTACLEVLRAEAESSSIEAVASASHLFAPLGRSDLHFGYTGDVYWFRLVLENVGPDAPYLLELNNPQLSSASLYTPSGESGYEVQAAGVDVPFAERPIASLSPSFKIQLDAWETKTCYLRVEHYGALRFRAMLYTEKAGHNHATREMVLSGLIAGALLGLAFYNGCVFIGLRQVSYLWISLMLFCMVLNQMTFSGTANALLWSGPGKWADHAFTLTGVLVISFGIGGSMSFLNASRNVPRLANFTLGYIAFGLSAGLASMAGVPSVFYAVAGYLVATPILICVMALFAMRHRSVSVNLFLGSWGAMLIGCVLFGLAYLRVVPANAFTLNFMYVAAIGASVAWSFALTRQISSRATRKHVRLEHKLVLRNAALEEALIDARALREFLAICKECSRVRDESGVWRTLNGNLSHRTLAGFTQRVCPDCAAENQ